MTKIFRALLLVALVGSTVVTAKYKPNTVDLSAYPKSDMFISAEDAFKRIGDKNVMFVSGDSPDLYVNYHIKGSVVISAHNIHHAGKNKQLDCAPLYQCNKRAEKLLSHKGISNDTFIIAYDNYKGSNATGVYSFFKSIGHNNVKILDGGFKAIIALDPAAQAYAKLKKELRNEKKPLKLIKNVKKYTSKLEKAKKANNPKDIAKNQAKLDKAIKKASSIKDFTVATTTANANIKVLQAKMDALTAKMMVVKSRKLTAKEKKLDAHAQIALLEKDEGVHHTHYTINHINTSAIASKQELLKAANSITKNKAKSPYIIVDARAPAEISGKKKVEKVKRGGHIPGATFLEWGEVQDEDRGVTLKTPAQLDAIFKAKGITKDKTIYTYCHMGAGRGSHIATALEAMGYKNVKVYTGSWDEWGNDETLPLQQTVLETEEDEDDEDDDDEE